MKVKTKHNSKSIYFPGTLFFGGFFFGVFFCVVFGFFLFIFVLLWVSLFVFVCFNIYQFLMGQIKANQTSKAFNIVQCLRV